MEITTQDLLAQRQELRKTQWDLHRKIMELGEQGLRNLSDNPARIPPGELARLLEVGNELGKQATAPDAESTSSISQQRKQEIAETLEKAVAEYNANASVNATAQ